MSNILHPGQIGTTSGYPATVIRLYSAGMVEVRTPGGISCIPVQDFVPEPDITAIDLHLLLSPLLEGSTFASSVDHNRLIVRSTSPMLKREERHLQRLIETLVLTLMPGKRALFIGGYNLFTTEFTTA